MIRNNIRNINKNAKILKNSVTIATYTNSTHFKQSLFIRNLEYLLLIIVV